MELAKRKELIQAGLGESAPGPIDQEYQDC